VIEIETLVVETQIDILTGDMIEIGIIVMQHHHMDHYTVMIHGVISRFNISI
jgi:hypothetical protein